MSVETPLTAIMAAKNIPTVWYGMREEKSRGRKPMVMTAMFLSMARTGSP